jgi:hypothetical protein
VAQAASEEGLTHLVLDVEGPGACGYLAMEEGLHRFTDKARRPVRVRVDVVPKGPSPASDWPGVRRTRRREGALGLVTEVAGRLELAERGVVVELAAAEPSVLAHLLSDLERAWSASDGSEPALARIHGGSGGGVRDPRTGASVARRKDVAKGQLEPFLEAWRHMQVQPAPPPAG